MYCSLVDLAEIRYLVGVEHEVGALANEILGLVTEDVQYRVGHIFIRRLQSQIHRTAPRSMPTHVFVRSGHDQSRKPDARRCSISSR